MDQPVLPQSFGNLWGDSGKISTGHSKGGGMVSAQKPVNPDCIFCKIIAGELPSSRVYETENLLAFLDLNPVAKGHTLIIPKGHYPTLLDVPPEEGNELIHGMKLIGNALMQHLNADGFNCMQNNFSAAGQMVFHSHWHIIPRFETDGLKLWASGKYDSSDEMLALAAALNSKIAG